MSGWTDMMITTAVILAVSTVVFYFFGTGKTQPWNEPVGASQRNTVVSRSVGEADAELAGQAAANKVL